MLPVLPVLPVFEVEPVEPVVPVLPVEPVTPVDPVLPVEPVAPVVPINDDHEPNPFASEVNTYPAPCVPSITANLPLISTWFVTKFPLINGVVVDELSMYNLFESVA